VHGQVLDRTGALVRDCGTGELVTLTSTDRVVEVQLAGGSGYGAPAERDRARLEDDVADGYVSGESASRDYGGPRAQSAAE
jgi:5-oxoprolinase (ATP-hydrolysing)/N-methylhydantoinase A